MRHGKKINHLSRTSAHRKAMLSNMASSLILHKRITTTVAKAKALRKYVEPLLTKSKTDSTHSRRTVFSYLQNKETVTILFNEVADRIADRPGGYTRILKTGNRLGDSAETCIIELVDYNDVMIKEAKPAKVKTRRSRRAGKAKTEEVQAAPAETAKTDKTGQKEEISEPESVEEIEEAPETESVEEIEEAPETEMEEEKEETPDQKSEKEKEGDDDEKKPD
jgi:large subunit ribosomal protein L17